MQQNKNVNHICPKYFAYEIELQYGQYGDLVITLIARFCNKSNFCNKYDAQFPHILLQ